MKGSPKLQRITIFGNVKIINYAPQDPDEKDPVLQYAIADHVTFDPETELMVLSSTAPSKVIFMDEINDIAISANRVEIQRNAAGKESIRGSGNVRFQLMKDELSTLREHFNLENHNG